MIVVLLIGMVYSFACSIQNCILQQCASPSGCQVVMARGSKTILYFRQASSNRSSLAGSPWFAPVRHRRRLRFRCGTHFKLVHRALCIIAPLLTPNKLLLTADMLLSQELAAALHLAVAAEERQHAIPRGLGSRAAFQASLGPISTH
jgi:hypothetical protein